MSGRTGFLIFVFVLATVMGVATTLGEGWVGGVRSFLIVFGFWVIVSFSRSDWLAQLRAGERKDERQAQIGIESLALAGVALGLTALVGGIWESSRGVAGPYSVMCAIGGASFLLAQVLLPRRR